MTIVTIIYSFLPPLADLTSDTHIFNSEWTPHARFHTVWLLSTTTSIGVLALYFLWAYQQERRFGTRLAAVLGLCVLGSFMFSVATMPLYGGALADPSGFESVTGELDGNLILFAVALMALTYGWFLTEFRQGGNQQR